MSGSPVAPDAAMLCAVQSGQSGQPRPDWLSRTAAPVRMIRAEVITPPCAQRRSASGVGASSQSEASRAQPAPARRDGAAEGVSGAARGADTQSMVGGQGGGPEPARYTM